MNPRIGPAVVGLLQSTAAFGAGATASNMHPVVLIAVVVASVVLFFGRKHFALAPAIGVIFLTPREQILVGGAHLSAVQIFAAVGMLRMLRDRRSGSKTLLPGGFSILDKLFLAWALVHVLAFVLLIRETGALVYQAGFLLEASFYFVCRSLLDSDRAVVQAIRFMVVVAAVLAGTMAFEYVTRTNLFSRISPTEIIPWIREGKVRAQGTFANSITAGVFGATLLPLFWWLQRKTEYKKAGAVGLASSVVIAVTSMSSTAIMAFIAGIGALCAWPLRAHMRALRIGVVVTLVAMSLAMRAPVWFILERVDPIGGHGWDRANLFDAAVHNLPQWWLLGTVSNAEWGGSTWDTCNEFITQATSGGLLLLILFIALLTRAFAAVGKGRRRSAGRPEAWFYWCVGAALFAHFIAFWGVDYFDQVRDLWYLFLAILAVSAGRVPLFSRNRVEVVSAQPPHALVGLERLAPECSLSQR